MATLEERVSALEAGQRQMREEWTVVAQAPLIQARLLNALRETQLEHSRTLIDHGQRLDRVEERLGRVEERLGRVEEGLGTVEHGIGTIIGMLDTLIERDDRG